MVSWKPRSNAKAIPSAIKAIRLIYSTCELEIEHMKGKFDIICGLQIRKITTFYSGYLAGSSRVEKM